MCRACHVSRLSIADANGSRLAGRDGTALAARQDGVMAMTFHTMLAAALFAAALAGAAHAQGTTPQPAHIELTVRW